MTTLPDLLAGREQAGVHLWTSGAPVDEIAETVMSAGWQFAFLDGSAVATRADFLLGVGAALGFPETYGVNFDALADLLDDVGATVLLWDGWTAFAAADERWFSVALTVLSERAGSDHLPPFVVLLRDQDEADEDGSEDALGGRFGE